LWLEEKIFCQIDIVRRVEYEILQWQQHCVVTEESSSAVMTRSLGEPRTQAAAKLVDMPAMMHLRAQSVGPIEMATLTWP